MIEQASRAATDAPVLVTGGAGFFGSLLVRRLIELGRRCVVLDLQKCDLEDASVSSIQGDIRDRALVDRLFAEHRFDVVMHCAAVLAHAVKDETFLWESNVDGTRILAEAAARHGTRALVFTSSNCLWASNMGRPVVEEDPPAPIEVYGRSKWEGERILQEFSDRLDIVAIRCPTIVDEGRLGLLAILFEFIAEGRKVWMIGPGDNRYQFIYAPDLADACVHAASLGRSATFNIGSDRVPTLRETFQQVIDHASTGARIVSVPKSPALAALRVAHALRISPLGPYHYRMIAEDFVFDTTRIRTELGWQPTLTNGEMLVRAYDYYRRNRAEIEARRDVSAHRQAARMGVLRLLKWVS